MIVDRRNRREAGKEGADFQARVFARGLARKRQAVVGGGRKIAQLDFELSLHQRDGRRGEGRIEERRLVDSAREVDSGRTFGDGRAERETRLVIGDQRSEVYEIESSRKDEEEVDLRGGTDSQLHHLVTRLKVKVRSQAMRLVAAGSNGERVLERRVDEERRSTTDLENLLSNLEQSNGLLREENDLLKHKLLVLEDTLKEIREGFTEENENVEKRFEDLNLDNQNLHSNLKKECYRNEKLNAHVEILSKKVQNQIVKAGKEDDTTLKGKEYRLTGSARPSEGEYIQTQPASYYEAAMRSQGVLESFDDWKVKSQDLKAQFKEFLIKKSKNDQLLIEFQAQSESFSSEVLMNLI